MKTLPLDPDRNLPAQIAEAIRNAIVTGDLTFDARLPSEAELSDQFGVSRPTVREALKRLAAQNLIRTQRGATGGAFVNRLTFEDAYEQQITTSTLLLSMNAVDFDTACEARFALERACAGLAAQRRKPEHLATMQVQLLRQSLPDLTDEEFCASDVAFHRALVDAADNPVLSYQLAGAVEAMQPLMNMVTFTARSRKEIIALHNRIADAIEAGDGAGADAVLDELASYTKALAAHVFADKETRAQASTA